MNRLLKNCLFAALFAPALANAQSFGVVEINATTLANGNAAIGDVTPGAPITITVPGTYRLAANLTVTGASSAIEVSTSAGPVTLDLNGFGLKGSSPGCSSTSSTLTCPAQGSSHGINHNGGYAERFRVANGTVDSFTGDGLRCSGPCLVDGITARANHGYGISVGGGAVKNSQAIGNGYGGISNSSGMVSDSSAYGNGRRGIVGGVLRNLRIDMTLAVTGQSVFGAIVQNSGEQISVGNTVGNGASCTGQINNSIVYGGQPYGMVLDGCTASRVTVSNSVIGIQVNSGLVRDSVMFNNTSTNLSGNPVPDLNVCNGMSC